VRIPPQIEQALTRWQEQAGGGLRGAAAALTAQYRAGATSSTVDVAAYVATRVPATFAANERVQAELAAVMPDFAPTSLLDVGAGPGTATWAALARWPSLHVTTQCEQDRAFADVAAAINADSGIDVTLMRIAEAALPDTVSADLVIASYMLAELPLASMAAVAARLWRRAGQVLVLIEPGTPQGFQRLRAVRNVLLGQGAFVLAPCTHQSQCPMVGEDWCHFKVRLQRSRTHMHAKQATVPFEDEAFSYLVLARHTVAQHGARVLSPPQTSKVGVALRLCGDDAVRETMIASRDKAPYKRAKKTAWGDIWE
jgi:ribosomal protein RSM22 (predicted rRNA methylase)